MSQTPLARLYIDGEWKEGPTTFTVHHPHSKEHISTAVSASSSDCKSAIQSASTAFKTWSQLTPIARRDILFRAADVMEKEEYKKRILEYTCKETGALKAWGEMNAITPAKTLREAAVLATQIRGDTIHSETPGTTFMVHRRPIGVIFAIAPWNAPGTLTVRAFAIPLVCGNTVVLKSSEVCPYTMTIIVEALVEAGLPKGVVNFLHMSREDSPKLVPEIIGHPAVRKINFTGSDRVGRILAGEAAKYLKPCVFELGGKAPCIVLEDADIKDASRAIVMGAMSHSGQICMSTERVIVQRGISKSLIQEVNNLVSKLTSDSVGPVFSEGHASGIVNLLEEAKKEGAEVIVGDLMSDGALVKPHVLLNIKPGMRAWDRESFGPVVGFAIVDTVDEAVDLANESDYSLTAAVWTKGLDGLQVAARVRASTVVLNGATFTGEPSFGIFGLGGATGYGRFDIEHWTEMRAIAIRPPNERYPFVDRLV